MAFINPVWKHGKLLCLRRIFPWLHKRGGRIVATQECAHVPKGAVYLYTLIVPNLMQKHLRAKSTSP